MKCKAKNQKQHNYLEVLNQNEKQKHQGKMVSLEEDQEKEIWKSINDDLFRKYFLISSFGRVKRIPYSFIGKNGRKYIIKEKIMSFKPFPKGYVIAKFYIEGKEYMRSVHRLLAKTFILNPFNYEQINHKDGNKTNNNIENIEWCTRSMNQKHRFHTLKQIAWNKGKRKRKDIECKFCKKKFHPKKEISKFCSMSCGMKYSWKIGKFKSNVGFNVDEIKLLTGLKKGTIYWRIRKGWKLEEILKHKERCHGSKYYKSRERGVQI